MPEISQNQKKSLKQILRNIVNYRNSLFYSLLLILITSATYLYCETVGHQMNNQKQILDQILQQVKLPLIEGITIKYGLNQTCPENFPLQITKFQWPGSIEGCNCDDGLIDIKKCCWEGVCQDFTCKGKPILSTNQTEIQGWKINQYDPFILCASTIDEINQFNSNNYLDEKGECIDKENFKLCTSENKNIDLNICIPKKYQCPIRDLFISQKMPKEIENLHQNMRNPQKFQSIYGNQQRKEQKEEEEQDFFFTDFLQIFPDQYLYINRESNAFPIQQFKIDEYKEICMNSQYSLYDETGDDYLLINRKRKVEDCLRDQNWRVLAQLKTIDFYQINKNFYDQVIMTLPKMKLLEHDYTYLLYQQQQPISFECKNRLAHKKGYGVENLSSVINHLNIILEYQTPVGLSLLFFISFIETLLKYNNIFSYGLPDILKNKQERFYIKFMRILLTTFKFILINAYLIILLSYTYYIHELFNVNEYLLNQNCFLQDKSMVNYLNEYYQINDKNSVYLICGQWCIIAFFLEPNFLKFFYNLVFVKNNQRAALKWIKDTFSIKINLDKNNPNKKVIEIVDNTNKDLKKQV